MPRTQYPVLLGYNIPSEKVSTLQILCAREGAVYCAISPRHYLLPLTALPVAGTPTQPADSDVPSVFSEEMLLFKGFSDDSLMRFLQAYRDAGLPKVELKATITPHNALWNSIELHEELVQERDALR
ncbi:MAG: DUF3783 domain-containing protein [Bacteroidaceae bacterium]|jgi:hypothetical protein